MLALDLSTLRSKHSHLTYQGYEKQRQDNNLLLTFKLHLTPDIDFRPTLLLQNLPDSAFEKLANPLESAKLDRLFHHIGLAELPSYFKAACPAEIIIEQVALSQNAKAWWHDLLIKGLGEFYYHNQIDFTAADWLRIQSTAANGPNPALPGSTKTAPSSISHTDQTKQSSSTPQLLVPVGGGKDSATVLAMLEKQQVAYDILLLAPHASAALSIAKMMQAEGHCQHIIQVDRHIDPQLIALNQAGYLNGHTPFSAYLAFVAMAVAYLYDHQEIILGNEASADEANLLYLGHEINHQYSKGSVFENKFREYCQTELFDPSQQAANIPHYFSLLRPFSELEITKQLSQFALQDQRFQKVLATLRSCNVGQQQGVWCHNCPKCAFVFAMFSAYLPPQFVSTEIFDEDLFIKPNLAKTFQELAGLSDKKPFECVGTFAEVRQAINLSIANYRQHQLAIPDQLFALQAAVNQEEWFTAMSSKSICILGMGREGQSTLAFLRQHWPDKIIALADQNPEFTSNDPHVICHVGTDYLEHLSNYQLIIKTAGIPPTLPEIEQAVAAGAQLSSNTELFFAFCPSQHIVGITGTKGKSTTSQLIYNILQQANRPSVLVGNIGAAALNQLTSIKPDTQVVFELSCHQLAPLKVSPHIAVVLDVKPEHLDYYSDFAAYQNAKSSITRFQTNTDYVVYNPQLRGASDLAKLSPAQVVTHSIEETDQALTYVSGDQVMLRQNGNSQVVVNKKDIPLLGEHNLYNVLPAVAVAAVLQIPIEDISAAIRNFKPLAHRLQQVAEINGVRYIDDSIAVNPHAAIMAIQSFPKNSVILIAGGYERQQDFSELVAVMVKMQVKQIFAMPTTGERLIATIHQQAAELNIQAVDNLEQAVSLAKAQAHAGDIVLLSPASASFNDFKDYAIRGDRFAQLVSGRAA